MDEIQQILRATLAIGFKPDDISAWQMGLRALVVYLVTVLLVRAAKKRFMGRATAFDVILGVMLGSIVSRAVTGNAPFVPALTAAAVLLALHWLMSWVALRWHAFGTAAKGRPSRLVCNGRIDQDAMRRSHMSENDLWEDLRGKGIARLEEVAEAWLERSGQLSVIKAKGEPKVIEVPVPEGAGAIRIEIQV